jgi:SSS family solute:Na+ symporter
MMLSFELFVILVFSMVVISLTDKDKTVYKIPEPIREPFSKLAVSLWTALSIVMIGLYLFFN